MLLHDILGLDQGESIFLAEESLEDLIDLPMTEEILSSGIDASDCIEVRSGDRLAGVALHLKDPADFWLLLTDRYSEKKVLEGCAGEPSEKVQVEENDYFSAIAEYYSLSLAGELLCESCYVKGSPVYQKDRMERLEALLDRELPKEMSILEVCCGDGAATQAMRRLGRDPMSMDSDRCDLCRAIKGGFLDPKKVFVMDARLLNKIFPNDSFDAVVGFMVGMIDDVNWPIWREIILKSSNLARRMVLYTVYTQREAGVIAKALAGAGWEGRIIDNRDRSGIYDQWAYVARRRC